MTYWTRSRWAALGIHALLALGLLAWSITSSIHFWRAAFVDEIYAYGAVAAIDGIALLGFGLYVCRVASPVVHTRHALPLVSALPLGVEMHGQFAHIGGLLAWAYTLGVTALLVTLSFVVWRTIERLYISPVEAAREYAAGKMQSLITVGEQMQVMHACAEDFVHVHLGRVHHAPMQIQSNARVDAGAELLHVAPMHDAGMHDAGMHDAGMHDAGMHDARMHDAGMHDARMHDAGCMQGAPMHDAPTFTCAKCGATVEITNNTDPVARRKASGRYGCVSCK